MFSGIIQGTYPVAIVEKKEGLTRYGVAFPEKAANLQLGASIAVDGVCQTVAQIDEKIIYFDAIAETLDKTTLKDLYPSKKVHIERSLTLGSEIGGHLLSGHIIGTLSLIEAIEHENYRVLHLKCPKAWQKYLFLKGFIALDGASLTIAALSEEGFSVHLIPETLRLTHFKEKQPGSLFNLELDSMTQAVVDTVERVLAANTTPLN